MYIELGVQEADYLEPSPSHQPQLAAKHPLFFYMHKTPLLYLHLGGGLLA